MLISHLKNEFARRRADDPRFSLRAFARVLAEDSATLSALLRGKRALTPKTARRLAAKLVPHDPALQDRFVLASTQTKTPAPARAFLTLPDDDFVSIHSWEHFAILSFLEMRNARATVRTMARRFGLEEKKVRDALERLERLKMVRLYNGRWVPTGQQLSTTDDVPSSALRQAHRQCIEKALVALEMVPIAKRDITGITVAIDPARLPGAKKMLTDFRRRLAEFLEGGTQREVYRLNLQLFPFTQPDRKED